MALAAGSTEPFGSVASVQLAAAARDKNSVALFKRMGSSWV